MERTGKAISQEGRQKNKASISAMVQLLLLLLALTFVCFGACRGEVDTVFTKAIRLCLECVGIG